MIVAGFTENVCVKADDKPSRDREGEIGRAHV